MYIITRAYHLVSTKSRRPIFEYVHAARYTRVPSRISIPLPPLHPCIALHAVVNPRYHSNGIKTQQTHSFCQVNLLSLPCKSLLIAPPSWMSSAKLSARSAHLRHISASPAPYKSSPWLNDTAAIHCNSTEGNPAPWSAECKRKEQRISNVSNYRCRNFIEQPGYPNKV